MPKVGIVISNYNGWQDTVQCLASLEKQTCRDFEIILLDDASTNDSVQQLQQRLPANTVFLPQQANSGFAAVNNVGMRRALADGCDWVLLLNNDTVAAPDFLETLLRQTPAGAVSCPKMLFLDPPDEIWPRKGRPRLCGKKAGQLYYLLLCAAAAAGHRAGGVPG